MLVGFVIWAIVGVIFIAMGVYCFKAKSARPFGFWSNVKQFDVDDVHAYNRALGKLWIVFGVIFVILGLPMLAGENSSWIIFSILGCMLLSIGSMVVYVVVIEPKYRKK